jgi:peptide/histidine transporter 3/4
MAFYGVASNLVVYLTTQLREATVPSVRNVNNWTGAVWMTPVVGAYIADTFLGRFWTFTISSLIYLAVINLNPCLVLALHPLYMLQRAFFHPLFILASTDPQI